MSGGGAHFAWGGGHGGHAVGASVHHVGAPPPRVPTQQEAARMMREETEKELVERGLMQRRAWLPRWVRCLLRERP
jgi:hypothetical protein